MMAGPRKIWIVAGLLLAATAGMTGCNSAANSDTDVAVPVLTSEASRGPFSLHVEFSPKSPLLSDEIRMSITVSRDKNYSLQSPELQDLFEDFLIADFDSKLPRIEGDKVIVEHVYVLEPLAPGEVTLEAIPYGFTNEETDEPVVLETEPLIVQVRTLLDSDEPTLGDLSDPRTPIALPEDPYRHVYWFAGGLGLLIALIVWRVTRKKIQPVVPVMTPRQIAERELEALKASGVVQTDMKDFFVQLTGIVRRYVEATTNIRAPEQTTDEFLREIERRSMFSDREQTKFRYFLEAADLVKYAAQTQNEAEISASLRTAEAFFAEPTSTAVPAMPNPGGPASKSAKDVPNLNLSKGATLETPEASKSEPEP